MRFRRSEPDTHIAALAEAFAAVAALAAPAECEVCGATPNPVDFYQHATELAPGLELAEG